MGTDYDGFLEENEYPNCTTSASTTTTRVKTVRDCSCGVNMIDPNWVFENHEEAARKLEALMKAIEPFAEEPTERMDTYPCHNGICTKERCGRCSRAIAAYKALHM